MRRAMTWISRIMQLNAGVLFAWDGVACLHAWWVEEPVQGHILMWLGGCTLLYAIGRILDVLSEIFGERDRAGARQETSDASISR